MSRSTDERAVSSGFDEALNGPTVAEGRLPYDAAEATGTIPTPPPPGALAPRLEGLAPPRDDDTKLDTTAPVRMPDDASVSALTTVPDGVAPDDDDDEARTQVAVRPSEVTAAPYFQGPASRGADTPSWWALGALVLALAALVFALLYRFAPR